MSVLPKRMYLRTQSTLQIILDNMDPQSTLTHELSYPVHRSSPDIQGFCKGYSLRRHKFEDKANEGSLQCRADWEEFIGPIERWGCCNPWNGHFGAVVLPFCKPERLSIISYIFECAIWLEMKTLMSRYWLLADAFVCFQLPHTPRLQQTIAD